MGVQQVTLTVSIELERGELGTPWTATVDVGPIAGRKYGPAENPGELLERIGDDLNEAETLAMVGERRPR